MEILLVVAALGILAGIVIIAINPGKQMSDTRDTQRKVDVNTMINAVYQYAIDNGSLPTSITSLTPDTATEICRDGATSCTNLVDLETDLVATYVAGIPGDPNISTCSGAANGTAAQGACYELTYTSTGRVTISAPDAENTTISVTR